MHEGAYFFDRHLYWGLEGKSLTFSPQSVNKILHKRCEVPTEHLQCLTRHLEKNISSAFSALSERFLSAGSGLIRFFFELTAVVGNGRGDGFYGHQIDPSMLESHSAYPCVGARVFGRTGGRGGSFSGGRRAWVECCWDKLPD